MPQIIADLYEIQEEIGSGGGGIVYLGRHLRLGKKIVLKADKRTLDTKPEVLRREVEALKDLSQTYIPQVYDYVIEDGVVYTVMDYIEGESLDKPLGRGERFSQAQVIEWACELLEALKYMHSRPPYGILHGDIKPANVMLTPEGDIRLIDFNIALALGEEGAVRVGYSMGYASPEHYGSATPMPGGKTGTGPNPPVDSSKVKTEMVLVEREGGRSSSPSSSGKGKLLDVRSDIYSLGATLYHLLSGRRPSRYASQVSPLTAQDGVSQAVAEIIRKAMEPDPDMRFQSAQEMLYAFEHLHETDPRTLRHQKRIRAAAAAIIALFLAGGLCSFTGLRQMQQAAQAAEEVERLAKIAEQEAKDALEAVHSSETAFLNGDIPGATSWALKSLEKETPYQAQGQKALTDALGVYDLGDGYKAHRTVNLPSEPLDMVLSPNGTRLAAVYSWQMLICDTETGNTLAQLPVEESALADILFLDEDRVVYAGPGAVKAYDLSTQTELWSGEPGTRLACSADGSRVAAIYKDETKATVYDARTGEVVKYLDFQGRSQRVAVNDRYVDPKDSLLCLNRDGTLVAVSFADGGLYVFDTRNPDNDLILMDPSSYNHYEGGFFGQYLAFAASGPEDSIFAVIDTVELVQTGGFGFTTPIHVQATEDGIFIANDNILVGIDPVSGEQTEVAYTTSNISGFCVQDGYALVATEDKASSLFGPGAVQLERLETGYSSDFLALAGRFAAIGSWDLPQLRLLSQETHEEADVFSYDPGYEHIEARLNSERSTVMLFQYDRFRLYGINGDILADVEIPDAEQVYDQQYRRDEEGSRLEVIYNDGTIRAYSGEDGSLLWERKEEAPDLSLQEEFLTDRFRITRSLHEAPVVYDRETGEKITELEKDANLAYVTQVGDYVITEYEPAQGEHYGLLLDENCQTLARLPHLCDILDDTLIFDCPSGILRQSRIYSLQELLALAET